MKRISMLAIAMLTIVPSVTKGYYDHAYGSWRYRVRWSPYVFGLVPGEARYSPYAYKYGHSGLVPYWIRYSPYAFSYKHPSGLVDDYASSMGSIYYRPDDYSYRNSGLVDCDAHRLSYAFSHNHSNPSGRMKQSYEKRLRARRAIVEKAKQDRRRINVMRAKDRSEIICGYLRSKNIDFKTNRFLKIDNKTVSVDFLLKDKNIIIKYWNPEEIQSLTHQPEYKRLFYEKYKESSSNFCEEYKKAGGKVYQIESANEREILARLMVCDI